jgi:FkbM family methyltransferase
MSTNNAAHIDYLLLNEAKGATGKDRLVFICIKTSYLVLKVLRRVVFGKRKRNWIYSKRKIRFISFLYKSIEFLHLQNTFLLVFDVPQYNYRFCSLVTRKVPNYSIDDMYASMTSHEEDVRGYFKPEKGDVVIDIGAAFGLYTILASKRVGLYGKVIAIEAHPQNFEMLNRNIKLNQLTNITCLNYAAYSRKTRVKINTNYVIMSEILDEKTKDKFLELNADTLDNILQQCGISGEQVNWIKIDVEGAELQVLEGARNTLSETKDITLYIEVHGQSNYDQMLDLLKAYSMKVVFQRIYAWGDRHIIATRRGEANVPSYS